MQSIDRQEIKQPQPKQMKRFVIREVESIQTTARPNYCACCCKGC